MATKLTTETDVYAALCRRFPPPAWAMFAGVSNGTGGRARRWADAVGMSIWPSRGLEIVGFEIKVSRRDWIRELKNPKKADEVGRYCDRWWIAAGAKDLVPNEELPPAWGLLVPHGDTMKIVVDAKKLEPKALDRPFLAAILRRAAERYDIEKIRNELRREMYAEIAESVNENKKSEIKMLNEREADLRSQLTTLRSQLQQSCDLGYGTNTIASAIDLLNRLRGWSGSIRSLDLMADSLKRDQAKLDEIMTAFGKAKSLLEELHGDDPNG